MASDAPAPSVAARVPVEDKSPLERFFRVRNRRSSAPAELRVGLITLFVMSYTLFVNPTILSTLTLGKGPDFVATVTMTALTAGVMSAAMGLYANYPIAMAAGMGLNAIVAFDLVLGRGMPWQAAMGVMFLEGVAITILVLTGFRNAVMVAIPMNLKREISVGIGVFIIFIGLVNAGVVWGAISGLATMWSTASGC